MTFTGVIITVIVTFFAFAIIGHFIDPKKKEQNKGDAPKNKSHLKRIDPTELDEEDINDILDEEYTCVGMKYYPHSEMLSDREECSVVLRPDVENKHDPYAVSVHIDMRNQSTEKYIFVPIGHVSSKECQNEEVFDLLRCLSRKEIYATMRVIDGNYSKYGIITDLRIPEGVSYDIKFADDFSAGPMEHVIESLKDMKEIHIKE